MQAEVPRPFPYAEKGRGGKGCSKVHVVSISRPSIARKREKQASSSAPGDVKASESESGA